MRSVTKSKRFFFNDTATTEIYTLSLHDALPISDPALDPPCPLFASPLRPLRAGARGLHPLHLPDTTLRRRTRPSGSADRKSTRLNSSYANISYAVFCLKKITTRLSRAYGLLLLV